jgi:hypothetical protein
MMGYPCLRVNEAFFACIERNTGYLIVKLPAQRVRELVGLPSHCIRAKRPVFSGVGGVSSTQRKEGSAMLREARWLVGG